MYVYVYIYIYIYICIYIYIHLYIYIQRERERFIYLFILICIFIQICIYIYIYVWVSVLARCSPHRALARLSPARVRPIRIPRIRLPRFVPRVGLPRKPLLIGNLTAALRLFKGWVRKDANVGLRTGCEPRSARGRANRVCARGVGRNLEYCWGGSLIITIKPHHLVSGL